MLSYRYVLRETGQNLWRNGLLALATVITVGVSLSMFGSFALFRVAVANATQRWENGIEFVVWMNADALPEEHQNVENKLIESPGVANWNFVDQEETYEEFREFFADTPELIENFTPQMLPPSYRVAPTDPDVDVVKELGEQFRGHPGVRTVVFAGDAIRDVQDLAERSGRVLFVGSVFLLGASALLILNMLAIAINNRRQEIEIMRVVGATKWFIRVPFMLEGLVHGAFGAALAVASNMLLRTYVIDQFSDADAIKLLSGFRVDDAAMFRTNLLVLIIAAVVSVIGSAVAVTMYLDE